MNDPRVQTDNPHEPLFEDGHFHIETFDGAWCVYDAFIGRLTLSFADQTEAIDATIELSSASQLGQAELDAAYQRLVLIARASMERMAQ